MLPRITMANLTLRITCNVCTSIDHMILFIVMILERGALKRLPAAHALFMQWHCTLYVSRVQVLAEEKNE